MNPSRTARVVATALAVACVGAPQLAWSQALGEVGESCRARADCVEGLRCIENTCAESTEPCTSDADCAGGQVCSDDECVSARDEPSDETEAGDDSAAEAEQGGEEGDDEGEAADSGQWADFRLGGTHFVAGLTLAPGLTGYWNGWGGFSPWASFFFAFKLGVLFNRAELSIELAPATWFWDFANNDNSVTFLVNIGGLVRLADNVYWPFRFGLGLAANDLPYTNVYMQGRLDLIGLVYHYGHLMFEINLPSIRFSSEFLNIGIWGWLFTISISYIV